MQETQETRVRSLTEEGPPEEEPTPVFLPGEFHRQRNLVGYSPWGHKESDTTRTQHTSGLIADFSCYDT